MARNIAEIKADFDALILRDFDYANPGVRGLEQLGELCDEMRAANDPAVCVPIMFQTMERLDGAELGDPGPLVHTIETSRRRYEELLAESVWRKPTPLSVWMVNRILNTGPPDAAAWMALLQVVAENPAASESTKRDAAHFVEYQTRAN